METIQFEKVHILQDKLSVIFSLLICVFFFYGLYESESNIQELWVCAYV